MEGAMRTPINEIRRGDEIQALIMPMQGKATSDCGHSSLRRGDYGNDTRITYKRAYELDWEFICDWLSK